VSARLLRQIEEVDKKAKAILADLVPLLAFDSIATDPEVVTLLNCALECAQDRAARAKTEHRLRALGNGNGQDKPKESANP